MRIRNILFIYLGLVHSHSNSQTGSGLSNNTRTYNRRALPAVDDTQLKTSNVQSASSNLKSDNKDSKSNGSKKSLMGYFQTQNETPIEGRINVTNITPRVTHSIFAFALVDGTTSECTIIDPFLDTKDTSSLPLAKLGDNGDSTCTADKRGNGNLAALYALKKENPHMRVLLSVGGASHEKSQNFSKATSSSGKVANLAKSCVNLAFSYGLDGIDYDWESPTTSDEWNQYNDLLTESRKIMDTYQYKERYLMSVALMPVIFFSDAAQNAIPKIAKQVDFVNLMTYDATPGSDRALHNSPLYSTAESYGAMSINDTVAEALKHFSPNKVMVGLPLYGISVTTTPNSRASDPDSNRGLFENVVKSSTGSATAGAVNGGAKPIMYNTIRDSYLNNKDFTRYWDDSAKATWLFNPNTNQFITYTDESSIQAVIDYVDSKGLGGVFFWQLGGSFNRKTSREELVEFTASHMSVDYTKRAVCAPQATFCNLRSECPADMKPDGTLPGSSNANPILPSLFFCVLSSILMAISI